MVGTIQLSEEIEDRSEFFPLLLPLLFPIPHLQRQSKGLAEPIS